MNKRAVSIAVVVVLILAVLVVFAIRELRKTQQSARLASCANDVIVFDWAVHGYAEAHDGLFPPIDDVRGNLMVEPEGFYPDYLDNSCWVQCEYSLLRRDHGGDKNDDLGVAGFTDDSFVYIPWAIRNEEEGLAFIEAYRKLDLSKRDQDLVVTIDGEERVLSRIRLTIAEMDSYRAKRKGRSVADGPPAVPYLIEWPDHAHDGAIVTFTDGYRPRMWAGDDFPMSKAFLQGLREIASIDRPVPGW